MMPSTPPCCAGSASASSSSPPQPLPASLFNLLSFVHVPVAGGSKKMGERESATVPWPCLRFDNEEQLIGTLRHHPQVRRAGLLKSFDERDEKKIEVYLRIQVFKQFRKAGKQQQQQGLNNGGEAAAAAAAAKQKKPRELPIAFLLGRVADLPNRHKVVVLHDAGAGCDDDGGGDDFLSKVHDYCAMYTPSFPGYEAAIDGEVMAILDSDEMNLFNDFTVPSNGDDMSTSGGGGGGGGVDVDKRSENGAAQPPAAPAAAADRPDGSSSGKKRGLHAPEGKRQHNESAGLETEGESPKVAAELTAVSDAVASPGKEEGDEARRRCEGKQPTEEAEKARREDNMDCERNEEKGDSEEQSATEDVDSSSAVVAPKDPPIPFTSSAGKEDDDDAHRCEGKQPTEETQKAHLGDNMEDAEDQSATKEAADSSSDLVAQKNPPISFPSSAEEDGDGDADNRCEGKEPRTEEPKKANREDSTEDAETQSATKEADSASAVVPGSSYGDNEGSPSATARGDDVRDGGGGSVAATAAAKSPPGVGESVPAVATQRESSPSVDDPTIASEDRPHAPAAAAAQKNPSAASSGKEIPPSKQAQDGDHMKLDQPKEVPAEEEKGGDGTAAPGAAAEEAVDNRKGQPPAAKLVPPNQKVREEVGAPSAADAGLAVGGVGREQGCDMDLDEQPGAAPRQAPETIDDKIPQKSPAASAKKPPPPVDAHEGDAPMQDMDGGKPAGRLGSKVPQTGAQDEDLRSENAGSPSETRVTQQPVVEGERACPDSDGDKNGLTWVQCVKCEKWRVLLGDERPDTLEDEWECSMNTNDPLNASCSDPERTLAWYNRKYFAFEDEDMITPTFDDVKTPLLKAGYRFPDDGHYCLPVSADSSKADEEHRFDDELKFREYLNVNHVGGDHSQWTEEEKEMVSKWVRYCVVRHIDLWSSMTPDKLTRKDAWSLLRRLGFGYAGRGNVKNWPCLPGFDDESAVPGVNCFERVCGESGLEAHLARHGLPASCRFEDLTDHELLSLELYLAEDVSIETLNDADGQRKSRRRKRKLIQGRRRSVGSDISGGATPSTKKARKSASRGRAEKESETTNSKPGRKAAGAHQVALGSSHIPTSPLERRKRTRRVSLSPNEQIGTCKAKIELSLKALEDKANDGKLVSELQRFLESNVQPKDGRSSGTSLLVCGDRGSGKTSAILSDCCEKMMATPEVGSSASLTPLMVFINVHSCRANNSETFSLRDEIARSLDIEMKTNKHYKHYTISFKKKLKAEKQLMILVVGDLEDLSMRQKNEFRVFQSWAVEADFPMILIGVAKSADPDLSEFRKKHSFGNKICLEQQHQSKDALFSLLKERVGAFSTVTHSVLEAIASKVSADGGNPSKALECLSNILRSVLETKPEAKLSEVSSEAFVTMEEASAFLNANPGELVSTLPEAAKLVFSVATVLAEASIELTTVSSLKRLAQEAKGSPIDDGVFVQMIEALRDRGLLSVNGTATDPADQPTISDMASCPVGLRIPLKDAAVAVHGNNLLEMNASFFEGLSDHARNHKPVLEFRPSDERAP